MRKGTLLLVAISLVIATASYGVTTGTATIQLYGWYNQIAAPLIPFDPNPRNVASGTGVFGGWLDGLGQGDFCSYLDPTSQGSVNFPSDWDYSPNILMGDGYMFWTAGAQGEIARTWTYDGVDISDTDAYISLPGQTGANGGWHYVGIPYPVGKTCSYLDIVVTNGSESHTILDMWSNDPGWMNLTWFGDDPVGQGTVQLPYDTVDLQGGKMYQVYTNVNNLALIIPHPL